MPKHKAKYRPPATFAQQPRIAHLVKLLKRKRGTTAAEGAKVLGWNEASIRGVISRLKQVGNAEITRRKERGRGTVYTLIERFTGRKDGTRLSKAQAAKLAGQGGLKPRMQQ
jgi:predicted ArsR family transcriptional regulator